MPRWWNGRHATLRSLWAKARESSNLFLGTNKHVVNRYDMKTLVAILTSGKLEKLQRCIESVLPQTQNLIVVCNTLDSEYENLAAAVAESYGIDFVSTESNGTPARGKNSVLDYFVKTDYTHLMQIDGDDYLVGDAITQITEIVKSNISVDVLGLTYNYMLFQNKEYTLHDFFSNQEIYQFAGIDGKEKKNLQLLGRYMAAKLKYNRMVLYSKTAANTFRFDESFLGAEDVVASYELYFNPKIKYVLTDEHIYVYELESGGNFNQFLSNDNTVTRVLDKIRRIVNGCGIQN